MSRQFDDWYFSLNDEEREEYDMASYIWEEANEIIRKNSNTNPKSDYDEHGLLSFMKRDRYDNVPNSECDVEMLFADEYHRTKCERCRREILFSNKNIYPGVMQGQNVIHDPYIMCPYCLYKNERLNFLPKNKRFYNQRTNLDINEK